MSLLHENVYVYQISIFVCFFRYFFTRIWYVYSTVVSRIAYYYFFDKSSYKCQLKSELFCVKLNISSLWWNSLKTLKQLIWSRIVGIGFFIFVVLFPCFCYSWICWTPLWDLFITCVELFLDFLLDPIELMEDNDYIFYRD